MSDRIGTFKICVEGPRWARFPKFLKNSCFMYNLKVIDIDIDKGWIRETVSFEVEGSESNLRRLIKSIELGIEEYNG